MGFWEAFFASDAWLLIGVGLVLGTFDKVMEWVEALIGYFQFLFIVDEYEQAVVLRLGRYNRTVGPGLHWCWPFNIEDVMKDTVVRTTSYLNVQSLTTKDGFQINSSPIVIYKIGNIKRWLLEVDDAEDALHDVTYGLNEELASESLLEEVQQPAYREELTRRVKDAAISWGARVEEVKLSDKVKGKSLRLWLEE